MNKGTVRTHKKILDLSVDEKTDKITIRLSRCPDGERPELWREMQFFVVATSTGLEAVESSFIDPPTYHFPDTGPKAGPPETRALRAPPLSSYPQDSHHRLPNNGRSSSRPYGDTYPD